MSIGPVILEMVGDKYIDSCRIEAIVWSGTTSSGDEARVDDPVTGVTLWPGRTDTTETYLGISFGLPGLSAPNGFRLAALGAGIVAVYIIED